MHRSCEFAEQAVAFEAFDSNRQNLADDVGRGHHMRGLKIGGAADDLAGIARGALEQHIDGLANRSHVEGRLLAVDQFLEPPQSLVPVFPLPYPLDIPPSPLPPRPT